MDLGAGFLTKLEPFLLMSKSAKGAAAAKLILDATGSPGVFVFGELLDSPSIQEVRTRQSSPKGFFLLCIQPSYHKMNNIVAITAFYNSSHTEHLEIISVGRTFKLAHLGLNLSCRGEGDIPPVERRSDHKTQAPNPRLPRHGAEGKQTHFVMLAPTESASSRRFYVTNRFSPPYKCQPYEIWRI